MAYANCKAMRLPIDFFALFKGAVLSSGLSSIRPSNAYKAERLTMMGLPVNSIINPPVAPMAVKRPLCNYAGVVRELSATDTLIGTTLVSREVPTGNKDASNCTFNLAASPLSGSEQVYLNGVLQNQGAGNDYTISTNTITFLTAPAALDTILVTYWK